MLLIILVISPNPCNLEFIFAHAQKHLIRGRTRSSR
jgi:hypothetical protein